MLTHTGIWGAIDSLAERHGLSPSGLARRAGLDPTTFNRSKRVSREGKHRWPSTESLSKVMEATNCSLGEFVAMMEPKSGGLPVQRMPSLRFTQAAQSVFFDDFGRPNGRGWDEVAFPDLSDPTAFVLEIEGDELSPFFRAGDQMVVSPQANVRRGDRVVVKVVNGQLLVRTMARKSALRVELNGLNGDGVTMQLGIDEIAWMSRVIWASQ